MTVEFDVSIKRNLWNTLLFKKVRLQERTTVLEIDSFINNH